MKKKGFTLIELLVVIAIIAMLMGMLMPALAAAKNKAMILVCGANLGGLGKAMLVYASDNEDNFPRAGGPKSIWDTSGFCGGMPMNWIHPNRLTAYGLGTVTSPRDGKVTVTASIYLLVKNNNITPGQAVCKADGAREFKTSLESLSPRTLEQVWDFGVTLLNVFPAGSPTMGFTGAYCSYAYQMPYYVLNKESFALDDTYNPDTPVLADRNPHLDMRRPAGDAGPGQPSYSHGGKGQNVWFKNGSAEWLKDVTAGIGGNNIYCYGTDLKPTNVGIGISAVKTDAYLVSERNGKLQ